MEVVSRPLDWLGINYYTRGLYKARPQPPAFPIEPGQGRRSKRPTSAGKSTPRASTDLLVRVSSEYTKLPLYVTENGMSEDRRHPPGQVLRRPPARPSLDAQKQGADVRGYLRLVAARQLRMGRGLSAPLRHRRMSTTKPRSAPPRAATAPSRACCTTRANGEPAHPPASRHPLPTRGRCRSWNILRRSGQLVLHLAPSMGEAG